MRKLWLFITMQICVCGGVLAQAGNDLFDPTVLHEIRLEFSQVDYWDTLTLNYQNWVSDQSADDVYTATQITIDNELVGTAGARFKGLSSYYYIPGLKKPMKIDLNEFVEGQEYDGITKFNLHNGAGDPTLLRDFLAYDVMRRAGVKVPRMSFAKIFINDAYFGVYGVIEQINKDFVHANFPSNGGTLIKNNGWSELKWLGSEPAPYQEDFQLKTNEDTDDWSDFIHFIDVINNTPDVSFVEEIEKVFDVNLFLHAMAVDVLLDNWDSYLRNERNWYLYHEPSSGKMQWIPWDYNLSLGGDVHPVGNPYPPIDEACDLITDFRIVQQADNTVTFIPKSNKNLTSWQWAFGDSGNSNEESPTHIYAATDTYRVCFWGSYTQPDGSVCTQRRCKDIDLEFIPADCPTIENGTSPYPASDPIYQQVVAGDSYCCEDTWDAVCDAQYFEIFLEQDTVFETGVEYESKLSLIIEDTDKVLAHRILSIPEYRQKYLDIVCVLLENNFNAERLFPLIDEQSALLKDAIYDDPNYIFTWDYYEYNLGDGSGGGNDAEIPALKYVLNQRFAEVQAALILEAQNCEDAFTDLNFKDVVINEFMASNDENSGIVDADGESEDWIELYNNTNTDIDLRHFYLSDREDKFLWNFPPNTVLPAEDYLIVWADKDEEQEGLHSNFKIAKSGGSLTLTHEDGTLIDSVQYEAQTTNVSSARLPNGIGEFDAHLPTFGINNETLSSTEEYHAQQITVLPNPANDFVNVSLNYQPESTLTYRLTDISGHVLIKEFSSDHRSQRINLNKIMPGIYLLEVRDDKKRYIQKIVVQ